MFFFPALQFSPVSIIPPLLHTHSFIHSIIHRLRIAAVSVMIPLFFPFIVVALRFTLILSGR